MKREVFAEKEKVLKTKIYLTLVVTTIAFIMAIFMYDSFKEPDQGLLERTFIKLPFLIVFGFFITLIKLINNLKIFRDLSSRTPIACEYIGKIIVAYETKESDGRVTVSYKAYPIVKSEENGKYYCSIGDDCLAENKQNVYTQDNYITIHDKSGFFYDEKGVEIKAPYRASMYMYKEAKVKIREREDDIYLNNSRVIFDASDNIGRDIFENLIFYKGFVDFDD